MTKTIQLRNVPDALHRKLKSRAARAGMSLSEYLLREIRHIAEKPTMAQMVRRLEKLTPVIARQSPAEIVREEREERDKRG